MNRSFIFIMFALIIILGGSSLVYTLNKCGPKGLLFGQHGLAVAASGLCDAK